MWYRTAKSESFGDRLRELLSTNESYEILGDEGTWAAGGCWILSEALRRGFGPTAQLMAMADDHCPHTHVVVNHDGGYYDAYGFSPDQDSLLDLWRREERRVNPRLVEFNPDLASELGIPVDEDRVSRLYEYLKPRLWNADHPANI